MSVYMSAFGYVTFPTPSKFHLRLQPDSDSNLFFDFFDIFGLTDLAFCFGSPCYLCRLESLPSLNGVQWPKPRLLPGRGPGMPKRRLLLPKVERVRGSGMCRNQIRFLYLPFGTDAFVTWWYGCVTAKVGAELEW